MFHADRSTSGRLEDGALFKILTDSAFLCLARFNRGREGEKDGFANSPFNLHRFSASINIAEKPGLISLIRIYFVRAIYTPLGSLPTAAEATIPAKTFVRFAEFFFPTRSSI